jgi:hypothetical protein
MFQITQDPSIGSYIQYLTKITDNGSIVQVLLRALPVLKYFKHLLVLTNYDLYNAVHRLGDKVIDIVDAWCKHEDSD